jgi:purine-nucleoside/S-methyl-5'-thioadenosine phosphorylase / adenosine deaminase
VIVAERPWPAAARPHGDAIVTRVPGLAVGVSTADCGPVLMADAQAGVIGAAHAGWRGALHGVIEAALAAMERLGADRGRVHAALGPMIRQPNYEVGPEFVARFVAADADNARFFGEAARSGHVRFDLPGFIRERLMRAGVRAIEDVGRCTYAEAALFYSYRRSTHRGEPDYGRHVNAIALADR